MNKQYIKNTMIYNRLKYDDIKTIKGFKYIYVLVDKKHYITLNKDVIKLGAFSYYNLKNNYKLNKKEFYKTLRRQYELNKQGNK